MHVLRKQLADTAQREAIAEKGSRRVETYLPEHDHSYNGNYSSLVRAQTAATADSARTLINNREIDPNLTLTTEKFACSCSRKRHSSSTSPILKDTSQRMLPSTRTPSLSSAYSGYEGSLERAGLSGIGTGISVAFLNFRYF